MRIRPAMWSFIAVAVVLACTAAPSTAQPPSVDTPPSVVATPPSVDTRPRVDPAVAKKYSAEIFRDADSHAGIDLPYRLLSPKTVEPEKKYPLVLFLHGAGERGDDNQSQLIHVAKDFVRVADRHPAFVVIPQCPVDHKWQETDWSLSSGIGEFNETPSPAIAAALTLVDRMADEFPVDRSRIYIAGLSMGGIGTWYAAAQRPASDLQDNSDLKTNRFAAMVAVCGGGDPDWADRYQGTAVWAVHGTADKAVVPERSQEMVAALATAGHHPELRLTLYPGVGHDSWTRTFAGDEVINWMFSQSRPLANP